MPAKTLDEHTYHLEPLLEENFQNLDRWISRDDMGKWEANNNGVDGEWIKGSPSLFLKEKIKGDFLWEITAIRLEPDAELEKRYKATKWGEDGPLLHRYNFNFWIRADAPPTPPGEKFLEAYPKYLKTGWNGMGDDHWYSYFNTVVWDEGKKQNWNRLRRSPGYEMIRDVHDVIPHMPYGVPHKFTFVVQSPHVRLYLDDKTLVYDFKDPHPYQEGYIGLCVWICKTRFEQMKLWRLVK